MKQKRKIFSIVLVIVLALSVVTIDARTMYNSDSDDRFTDVDEDHWAYQYIKLMSEYNIINGYGDGRFGPSDKVSRQEFAKMMVLTLQLDTISPSTPYFEDVSRTDWAYKYVETGKSYLTGYITGDKYYFRPTADAEREDMAVAIVRGLGISVDGVDLSILDQFADAGTISPNLKPYVAKAVEEGIMIGDDQGNFGARNTLKRAEAATLLYRLIEGEKVVFDEEKIVIDPTEETVDYEMTPVLTVYELEEKIKLDWTEVYHDDFKYYKVVVSKYNSSPSYPDDGYAQAIGSVTTTRTYLEPWQGLNGADVSKLQPGESYYVAITAVYEGSQYYTSNVEVITIPEAEEEVVPELDDLKPTLTGYIDDGGIKLDWTDTPADGFVYYKVVLSRNDTTPIYPGDGYLTYISDRQDSDYFVHEGQHYNGGDVSGELDSGETYHISITAVYKINGQSYYAPSNTLTFVLP